MVYEKNTIPKTHYKKQEMEAYSSSSNELDSNSFLGW